MATTFATPVHRGVLQSYLDADGSKIVDLGAPTDPADAVNKATLDTAVGNITGILLFGSGAPSGGTGVVGNSYINIATGALYEKTGVTTWTKRGHLASNVTNLIASYVCPDAVVREATLTNP